MKRGLFAVAMLCLATLVFQNCGAPTYKNVGDPSLAGFDLAYPYSAKPQFYVDAQVLYKKMEGVDIREFKVFVNIGDPKSTREEVSYQVDVQDSKGEVLCPSHSGVILPGQSAILFDCVSAYIASQVRVIVSLRQSSNKDTVQFIF